MNAVQIAGLTVVFSIFLVVLSLGLRTSLSDAMFLFRHRRLLLWSVLSMNVAMPALVVLIVMMFGLHPAVKVALIALAVSPVPPFLPGKELKLVVPGHETYVYGLLVASSILAIVIIPLTVGVVALVFDQAVSIDPPAVARVVALSVLVPLGAGTALRHWIPAAGRWSAPVNTLGMALLALSGVVVLMKMWPAMIELIRDGTLVAIIAVTLIGLGLGHLLGGPAEDDRTVLALATASRHPGVALAVAGLADQPLAPAAVLLALLVSMLTAAPYTAWRKRRLSAPVPHRSASSR
jgi:BASS family bile acid:Na+ symporter